MPSDGSSGGEGNGGNAGGAGGFGGSSGYGGSDSGGGWTGNRSERDARDAGNMAAGNQDGGPAGNKNLGPLGSGMYSPSMSYADVQTIAEQDPNAMVSPTQTAAQAMASKSFHDFANTYAKALPSVMGMPPGISSLLGAVQGLAAGTTTIGGMLAGAAMSAAAASLGVSTQALNAALSGNFGAMAADSARNAVIGSLANSTGLPGMALGIIGKETGLTGALTSSVSGAVSSALGDTSTGFSVGNIAKSIDGAIGTTASAAGLSVPDLTNRFDPNAILGTYTLGDGSGSTPDTPAKDPASPTSAATPAQQYSTTYTASAPNEDKAAQGADVGGGFDPFGGDIRGAYNPFSEHTDPSLYGLDPVKFIHAAEGGSIEDLLAYLRS